MLNIFTKVAKTYPHQFLLKIDVFIIAKKSPNIWATFVIIFVNKNFQKSPNLITRVTT